MRFYVGLTACAIVAAICLQGESLAGVITLPSDSALAGATVVDFNSETKGSFTSRVFGDLTISTTGTSLAVTDSYPPGSYGMEGNCLTNYTSWPYPDNIRIDFAAPVSAFGFDIGAVNWDWTLTAFNASGTSLEVTTVSNQYPTYAGYIGLSAPNIAYATLVDPLAKKDTIYIDDIAYVAGTGPVPGALVDKGHITYDPNTLLEWLDWTETAGLSYNQVIGELGPGGAYEGFRYASGAEVAEFFDHAGLVGGPPVWSPNHPEPFGELIALVGATGMSDYGPEASAVYGDVPSLGTHALAEIHDQPGGDGTWAQAPMPYQVPDDEYGEWFGHALVRQIPEPSTFIIWSLLGALGVSVGWWRRKRGQK